MQGLPVLYPFLLLLLSCLSIFCWDWTGWPFPAKMLRRSTPAPLPFKKLAPGLAQSAAGDKHLWGNPFTNFSRPIQPGCCQEHTIPNQHHAIATISRRTAGASVRTRFPILSSVPHETFLPAPALPTLVVGSRGKYELCGQRLARRRCSQAAIIGIATVSPIRFSAVNTYQ